MKEGEVVFRIGMPDHEAFHEGRAGRARRRPGRTFRIQEPDTLTVVTLRAGVVTAVERKVVR
ncbi:MAG: hypothetical protein U1F50_13685 [Rubrivivax sp.]